MPEQVESTGLAEDVTSAEAIGAAMMSPACSSRVALFGGHGASGGQMRELRRVATEPRVAALLKLLSDCLDEELARWREGRRTAKDDAPFECGLNVHGWSVGEASRGLAPSLEYLQRIHVAVPLLFVAQLCNFLYFCCHPPRTALASSSWQLAGACGHSQGLASAIVVAVASARGGRSPTDASFFASLHDAASTMVRGLFWVGLRVREATTPLGAEQLSSTADDAGGGGRSEGEAEQFAWMLGVSKMSEAALEAAVREVRDCGGAELDPANCINGSCGSDASSLSEQGSRVGDSGSTSLELVVRNGMAAHVRQRSSPQKEAIVHWYHRLQSSPALVTDIIRNSYFTFVAGGHRPPRGRTKARAASEGGSWRARAWQRGLQSTYKSAHLRSLLAGGCSLSLREASWARCRASGV